MAVRHLRRILAGGALLLTLPLAGFAAPETEASNSYSSLVRLFEEWRDFEHPTLKGEVADYGAAAMSGKAAALPKWRRRLDAVDTRGWAVDQLTDYRLVAAEMNGLDFNLRVLRPWARDPAFYVSVWSARTDVPLREGPSVYPEIELYTYRFPLSSGAQRELIARIGAIPALLDQARENLKDSDARDLWLYGAQGLRAQSRTLGALAAGTLTVSTLEGSQHADISAMPALKTAISHAQQATDDFVAWLEHEAPGKRGPSGIGKEDYTWYQQN